MPPVTCTPGDEQQQLTRVNGIGLWNSWTRNFKTPLLALLDLLDNSVDAAFAKAQDEPEGAAPVSLGGGGKSSAISHNSSSSSRHQSAARGQAFNGKIHIDADTWDGRATGLKIINNSRGAIKDLGTIMEVYSSSKGRVEHGVEHSQDDDEDPTFADSIGENGVGLKQGCATLSDLSFILARAADGTMGMAVIAQNLQTPAGVYLPHIYFKSTDMQLLKNEMRKVFSSPLYSGSVGECVARYGNDNVQLGIDRLLRHFAHLNQRGPGEWGEEKNVFCVVLHELKHGRKVAGTSQSQDDEDHFVELMPTQEQQHNENAHFLMQELQDELPRNYIHIDIEVRVDGEDIHFFYWQRRLAELTVFDLTIDEVHSHMEDAGWNEEKGYPLRVFCGFDAVSLESNKGRGGSCSLHIYSRFSGRLIKYEEDARALLKLTSGGTDFSQGLTIIADDMLGKLPLNPTKQDVAFGEQAHGDVHKRNLFAWLSAITRLYYKHHLETKCRGKKTDLTRKVTEAILDPDVKLPRLKPLADSDLAKFKGVLTWKRAEKSGAITCTNRKTVEVTHGRDTLLKLSSGPAAARKSAKKRKKTPPASSSFSDPEDDLPLSVLSKRQRAKVVDYNEDDADELEDDAFPGIDLSVPDTAAAAGSRRKKNRRNTASPRGDGAIKEGKNGAADRQVHSLQAQNEGLREEIESLHDDVKRQREKLDEGQKLAQEMDGVQEENERLRDKVRTQKEKLNEGKKVAREMDDLQEGNESLREKVTRQREKLDEGKKLAREIDGLQEENESLRDKVKRQKDKLDEGKKLERKIDGLQEENESLLDKTKRQKEKLDARKRLIRTIDDTNEQLKTQIAALEAQLSAVPAPLDRIESSEVGNPTGLGLGAQAENNEAIGPA